MQPLASTQSLGTATGAAAAAAPPPPPSAPPPAAAAAATASTAAAALPSTTPPATAGEGSEFDQEGSEQEGEGTEQEVEKQRKRHRGRKLGDMNVIPELERKHFEQLFEGIVRCKPCTWAGKKDVLVSLYRKDAVKSHLGT
eukprot:56255-Eustigmatos_ZCMA.PRE.1